MASMAFIDEHNEIAMLQKPKQAAGFHQIVDFLKSSHIAHALTVSPSIYIEHQKQFWANATAITENGVHVIKTRVCDKPLTVSEEVIRISLRLDDASGITSISNDDLFSTLTRMGYGGPLGVFKFSKAKFSPQWRFFVQTLMHCISRKTTGWSEFSSTIAYALVCLATARKYNFSIMIFNDLVSNLENKKSFFMYPRFVQAVITTELTDMPQFDEVYVPKIPKGKVFSNMKRSAMDSEGVDTPLFSTMMVVKKAPSLLVPSPTKPLSPLMENYPLENIYRETTGVSPNPKEVLTEEMHEHMGEKVATTPASTKEVPGAKNPGGVAGASARQKTSTTKCSNDPSKGGNTPEEGEDRYNYQELMDTMGNINRDVIKQGADIEEMKLVILSQQVQITKLKKMVKRLVQKKKRKQYVLKKRGDAFKKGEKQDDGEKLSPSGMEAQFEGGQNREAENKEAEASTEKQAAVTGLSVEELEIAETLVKAKNDTPKATQKAKGVVIKEGGLEQKIKEISEAELKKKGKAKMVEPEQPLKQQKQIELDEEVAKQLQAEMEKEEQLQSEKDRELALNMAKKLNEEYQKSLKIAAEAKKSSVKVPKHRMPVNTQKRQPSKTYLANQERRKMINFLRGSIGVKGEMFANMAYSKVEELYKKEMVKLQGDFSQREEVERRMKERHDLNIQQPFPEETTPSKENDEKKEEQVDVEAKYAKRVKTIASKKQSKKPRIEDANKEAKPSVANHTEQTSQSTQQPNQSDEHVGLYMTLIEPVQVIPISVKAPEIIFWDILRDNRKDYFRLKRVGACLKYTQLGAK
ncbi:hypothetical protein L6452_07142 [Arctium lappa]|uniref:Uncharacterized protein n=1 Tax=Arctium lappa TaxID=4217 RepID=A0ACB9EKZ3_ARCLA|nr:hypothetical protein L6452_07142 [Arctium lappa]